MHDSLVRRLGKLKEHGVLTRGSPYRKKEEVKKVSPPDYRVEKPE